MKKYRNLNAVIYMQNLFLYTYTALLLLNNIIEHEHELCHRNSWYDQASNKFPTQKNKPKLVNWRYQTCILFSYLDIGVVNVRTSRLFLIFLGVNVSQPFKIGT